MGSPTPWDLVRTIAAWAVLVLTLTSLAMLHWYVIGEMRFQREIIRALHRDAESSRQEILTRLRRLERDGPGR